MSCSSAPVTAISRSIPGKKLAAALTAWATERRVLEQPAGVGLVVVLGGRSLAKARPGAGLGRRRSGRAAPAASGFWIVSISARSSASSSSAGAPAPRPDPLRSTRPASAGRTAVKLDLAAELGVDRELAPVTITIAPGSQASKSSATPSQAIAGPCPVRSASTSSQEVVAVALLAQLALADDEGADELRRRRRAREAGGCHPPSPALPCRCAVPVVEERSVIRVIEIRGVGGQDSPLR